MRVSLLLLIGIVTFAMPLTVNAQRSGAIVVDGQLRLIRNVQIPVRESGVLTKLNVEKGDLVKAGDLIAEVDVDLHALNRDISSLEKTIAELESKNDVDRRFARKSMEVSSAILARSEKANERYRQTVSQTELAQLRLENERDQLSLEQAEMMIEVAQLEAQRAEKQLAVNELRLGYRSITAPWDGLVVETFPQEGEWLDPGEPVLRLIDLGRLHVEARLDANRVGSDLLGRAVEFMASLPNGEQKTVRGVVNFVSPEVEPITQLFTIQAEIVNEEDLLRPGTRGTLKILNKLVTESGHVEKF